MPALTFKTERGQDGRYYAFCDEVPGSVADDAEEAMAVEALIAMLLDRWDHELHRTLKAPGRPRSSERIYTAELSVAV